MSEISKAYEPQSVEDQRYQFWIENHCFTADPARVSEDRPAFSIVIPPPNVTGMLHMGHVLNNTIQDILSRKARMDGKEVLWLPGTDHAGIATQAVVEKTLRKEGKMKHRDDLGREKFLEHVWTWKEKHGGIIINQLKKLGCSCDWSRERFTMDPEYSRCVQKVFVELYKKGLIYRGKRMVNWDPAARTALSDEEVEMTETKGHLWHLKYPLLDDKGQLQRDAFVIVATTRPETMLGDEAVAVNPKDERYTKLIGRKLLLPLQNKAIPVIADDFVDPKFGTGCVKVTPAHDPNDYAMAQRHNLPITVVIGPDGNMTKLAGEEFDGMDRMEAREAVVEELTEQGLLHKVEDYVHNVGFSQRSHVPIEPYLSEQWFLKYPSVEKATACVEQGLFQEKQVDAQTASKNNKTPGGQSLEALTDKDKLASQPTPGAGSKLSGLSVEVNLTGQITFHPERWSKTYSHWMHNLRDWCISRQLWWGHRVPVWTGLLRMTRKDVINEIVSGLIFASKAGATVQDIADTSIQINGEFIEPDLVKLKDLWNKAPEILNDFRVLICTPSQVVGDFFVARGFTQDSDVLDTWFSSWLWPFATMGWPEKTPTLKAFYPTTDLVTGPDIIFFWVARMIMAGYEFMGDLPFRNVYFTGIIRDKLGRKMSKSLGNSPDPLDLIAKYGADALRFGTMRSAPLGQDVLFDEKDVELGRNFCNKLWNACRFRQMQGGETEGEINPALLTADDQWILLRLDTAIREITNALNVYHFNEAAQALYRFFWSEYCDWYIEASKAVLQGGDPALKANTVAVIDFILSNTLRLFHPFLPFITEELWHGLGYNQDLPDDQGGKTIMFARWPKPFDDDFKAHYRLDAQSAAFVDARCELVGKGRNLRREYNIASNKRVRFVLKPAAPITATDAEVLRLLLNAETVELTPDFQAPKGTPTALSPLGQLYMPLEGLIDVAAEKARLTKELGKIEGEIGKLQERLNNPGFTQKVPPNVLEEHQKRLADWQAKQQQLRSMLANLGG